MISNKWKVVLEYPSLSNLRSFQRFVQNLNKVRCMESLRLRGSVQSWRPWSEPWMFHSSITFGPSYEKLTIFSIWMNIQVDFQLLLCKPVNFITGGLSGSIGRVSIDEELEKLIYFHIKPQSCKVWINNCIYCEKKKNGTGGSKKTVLVLQSESAP